MVMDYKDSFADTTADRNEPALWLLFFIFFIFVAMGIWIAFDAGSSYDMVTGGLSVIFFCTAAILLGYKLKK